MNGDNENNTGLGPEIIDITDTLLIRWLHTLAVIHSLPSPRPSILMTVTLGLRSFRLSHNPCLNDNQVIQSGQLMTHLHRLMSLLITDISLTRGDINSELERLASPVFLVCTDLISEFLLLTPQNKLSSSNLTINGDSLLLTKSEIRRVSEQWMESGSWSLLTG